MSANCPFCGHEFPSGYAEGDSVFTCPECHNTIHSKNLNTKDSLLAIYSHRWDQLSEGREIFTENAYSEKHNCLWPISLQFHYFRCPHCNKRIYPDDPITDNYECPYCKKKIINRSHLLFLLGGIALGLITIIELFF